MSIDSKLLEALFKRFQINDKQKVILVNIFKEIPFCYNMTLQSSYYIYMYML